MLKDKERCAYLHLCATAAVTYPLSSATSPETPPSLVVEYIIWACWPTLLVIRLLILLTKDLTR